MRNFHNEKRLKDTIRELDQEKPKTRVRITPSKIDPLAHTRRKSYKAQQKDRRAKLTHPRGAYMMKLLVEGTYYDPHRAVKCAQRLLAEYHYAELGDALYMRCRNLTASPSDPIRAKVVPRGKPGRMNERERREYGTRMAVRGALELVSE